METNPCGRPRRRCVEDRGGHQLRHGRQQRPRRPPVTKEPVTTDWRILVARPCATSITFDRTTAVQSHRLIATHRLFIANDHDSTVIGRFSVEPACRQLYYCTSKYGKHRGDLSTVIGNPLVAGSRIRPPHKEIGATWLATASIWRGRRTRNQGAAHFLLRVHRRVDSHRELCERS
jgi:hypothetical protein